MAITVHCAKCSRLIYAPDETAGKSTKCPGCGDAVSVPKTPFETSDQPITKACPKCGNLLRLVAELNGKNVRCKQCQGVLAVAADENGLAVSLVTVENGYVNAGSSPSQDSPSSASTRVSTPAAPPVNLHANSVQTNGVQATANQTRRSQKLPPGMPAMPKGMPPMPETFVGSGRAKTTDDLLSGYRSRSKPTGTTIKEGFFRGTASIKKKTVALKVAHDIKSLQSALESQLENLGTLTLTHRPPVVDIGGEIGQLSQIQDEIAQKQTTIASLRQTSGSRSVIKEMENEVAQRQDRQRAEMIAIGNKAAAVRAEMPGATGVYDALDRLNSSLVAKQAELDGLEVDINSLGVIEAKGFDALKKLVILIAKIAVIVALFVLIWWLLSRTVFAADLPKWVRYYVPNDAQIIAYFNADTFRKTTVFEKIKSVDNSPSKNKAGGNGLGFEKIRDIFIVIPEQVDESLTIIRAYEDLPLKKIVADEDGDFNVINYRGFEYAHSSGEGKWCAKTGVGTYCIARTEQAIENALKRLDGKKEPRLNKRITTGIETVGGKDCYLVCASIDGLHEFSRFGHVANTLGFSFVSTGIVVPKRLERAWDKALYATRYISFNSTVSSQQSVVFEKPTDAEDFRDAWESLNAENIKDQMEKHSFPKPSEPSLTIIKRFKNATTITQDGNAVYIQTNITNDDVDDIVHAFEKSQKQSLSR